MNYQEILLQAETWIFEKMANFPERKSAPMISFTKEGLASLFHRLEELKIEEVDMGAIYDEATRKHALVRRIFKDLVGQEQDVIADSVEKRAGDLVSRGMAAEERMSLHRNRAIDTGLWRRRFETLVDDMDSLVRLANARHFALSAEREDIRAQIRAINLGVEISEIST